MGKLSKEGWLEKKGKQRWFVLKGYRLFWYSNEQSGTENGNLDLSLCTVSDVLEDTYFIIGAGYIDKQYKIVCSNGVHEARAWVKAISNAIESAQKKHLLKGKIL